VKPKPVVPRKQASRDVERAIDHYIAQAGPAVAATYVDALETAYRFIARNPGAGSLRYAYELDLPDLRAWPLKRFPYLVFYLALPDRIDVWRVLHARSDIPAWMLDQVL
jgi:toxin ParE1/3/4